MGKKQSAETVSGDEKNMVPPPGNRRHDQAAPSGIGGAWYLL